DVGGLEVAMHDQAAVRAVDRLADGLDQPQARRQVEVAPRAVVGDRLAVPPFEREVWTAVGTGAAVEQAREVRMVEAGEDLALAHEAPHDRLRIHGAPDELERE